MAKIPDFNADLTPQLGDYLLGSSADEGYRTVNFPISGLVDLVKSTGVVSSINGQVGDVILVTDNISDILSSKKYVTQSDKDKLSVLPTISGTPDGTKFLRDDGVWTTVSGGGGGGDLSVSDIDTLVELNTIITDATLIDTSDARLSDQRTPSDNSVTTVKIVDDAVTIDKVSSTIVASLGLADTALQSYTETDPVFIASQANNITSQHITDLGNLSGVNTGDQTSIVGITGTKAQFDTAVTDGNFMYIGDAPTSHTHTFSDISSISGTPDGSKFLRDDGVWSAIPGGGDALTASPLSQFASTTSAQLLGVISDETGTGALVFATSPTLVTPDIGVATATTINGATITSGTLNGSVTGTNTGDQTSIVGITGTKAEFDTAVTDGNFLYVGDAGDVSKVGTPANNELGVWTGDGTIEGESNLTFNGTELDVTGNVNVTGSFHISDTNNISRWSEGLHGDFTRVYDTGDNRAQIALVPNGTPTFTRARILVALTDMVSDAVNYETAFISSRADTNEFWIGSEAGGTGTVRPLRIKAGTNNAINILADGKVGIAKDAPTVALDVIGAIAATSTITGSNLSGTNTGDQDLSSLAPKSSPTFTGTPVLPGTFTIGTNSFIRSGAHNLTLTTTAATNITLPTTGTLVTQTGTSTLTNKTITNGVNTITTPAVSSIGYLGVPQNSKSTAYTLVLSDAGKHILHPSADTTARTFTIPANSSVAFPIGTTVTFVNQNGGGDITIAITTDTMRLAGAGTTGSRTLTANGMATAIKVTATEWLITGTNLS